MSDPTTGPAADPAADPTLDRLLRHMAWANATLFAQLATLPASALALASPRNEWTAAMIAEHIEGAAGGYAARLEGVDRPERAPVPADGVAIAELAARCAAYDARLHAQAVRPDGIVEYLAGGILRRRARSTILGQAIHHATEHRAQIAGALATNGIDLVDLDDLDVWAYGDAEGLGA